MKDLIINGLIYAKYEIDGDTIYIKMIIQVIPESSVASENALIYIIQLIENTIFNKACYLNI
ncbi:MAG: hypothetical protein HOP11_03500 [Saprospiraceae bacterium]|nr:hypothetical protein [Saprospiraceae bacterium]